MKIFKFLIPLLLLSSYLTAQEKILFLDFNSIIEKVNECSANGDYEKALEHLDMINKNDSLYCSVLVSKSYYMMSLEQYDEAILIADEGLERDCYDTHSSFYVNKAVAKLGQERYEEAIEICSEGLKKYPYNNYLWHNKAVALEQTGRIEEAVGAFEQAILLDPLYRLTYLKLGNLCYQQGLTSQALMCLNMYLFLGPDAENAFNSLRTLNDIAKSTNENSRNPEIIVSEDDEYFEELDLIINNRIALNDNYEINNEIDIPLTRQNHILIEYLSDFSGGGGFWDAKFVPFYKWVYSNNMFDVFTYTLSYSIENDSYKKIVEKKIKEIAEFFESARQKWLDIVIANNKSKNDLGENITYYYDGGFVQGVGEIKGDFLVGPWEFVNVQGGIIAKGIYNESGNREGEWHWFNDLGKLRETAWYEDGTLKGSNIHYFDNGRQNIVANYKDDYFDGQYLLYNEKGALVQNKYFKEGELNGLFRSYYEAGEELPLFEVNYENGSIKDDYVVYHPTGEVSTEVSIKDGDANGRQKMYYLNGQVKEDYINKDGLSNGAYEQYYSNGSLKEKGQFSEGNYIGSWQKFFNNNQLECEFTYGEPNELDGEYKCYDNDGKMHYIFEYRKGEFIAYKYFDKDGNVIGENRKKGGEFYYTGYSPYGAITAEGIYDIKGGKKGVWKYYTTNGVLTDETYFEDDKLQGAYKSYYANGDLMSVAEYRNDTLNGYCVYYNRDGGIERQGWYANNMAIGEWRSYAPDGVVREINFYHKGNYHGEQHFYSGTGVKTRMLVYNYGAEVKDYYYKPDGELLYSVDYERDVEKYEVIYKYFNGEPKIKMSFVSGVHHGPYTYYSYDGKILATGQYLNGKLNGEWIWYYENGNKEIQSNYIYGELNGDYYNYFKGGGVDFKTNYLLNETNGAGVSYYENGAIRTKSLYHFDKRHGRRESYSPSGQLQVIRFYNHGRLMGYSYLDKNGEEIPMIPFENETGKIKAYFDNGNVSWEMDYENGSLMNTFKRYSYSGVLLTEIDYLNDLMHGKKIEYFTDGTVKEESYYHWDNLHGVLKEYYENGNLQKEETYFYGVKEGVTKKYDKNKKLLVEEVYFNDDIISITTH